MQEDIRTVFQRYLEIRHAGSSTMRKGVFVMSVAADELKMDPQTLRKYERVGLVMPSRRRDMPRSRRMYSREDIARLRLIKHLVKNLGLNLAGVQMAMELLNKIIQMREQMTQMEGQPLREALNESLDEMLQILAG